MSVPVEMSHADWLAEAERRFGHDPVAWRFVCPVCGNVATGQEFKDAGAPASSMAIECIGRRRGGRRAFGEEGPGPCDYAAYGLFQLAPVRVVVDGDTAHAFAFADSPEGGGA